MASSLPPELLQFLQEQNRLEDEKIRRSAKQPNISSAGNAKIGVGPTAPPPSPVHQFPEGRPSMGNVPDARYEKLSRAGASPAALEALRTGKMSISPGVGANPVGRAGSLRGAGTVAGLASLAPVAWGIGRDIIGQSYYDTVMEEEYKKPNPYAPQPRGAQAGMGDLRTSQGPEAVTQSESYLPEELIDFQVPQQPVQEPVQMQQEEVPPEMMVEATEEVPPEMLVEAQLLQQQAPPRVEEFPESRQTLQALGKNKTAQMPVRRETPKRGFFGHVGEFLRTGGRNRERDDYNAELETYERANRLTDPEKLSAGVAEKDIFSARAANYGGDMAKYSGQGVSPADKYMADYGEAVGKEERAEGADIRKGERDLSAAKELVSAKSKSIDEILAEFQSEIGLKYPDLDPSLLERRGIKADPASLESIRKGREGGQGDKIMQTMMLLQALRGQTGLPDKTPASQKVKQRPEVKDTSMLQKTEK